MSTAVTSSVLFPFATTSSSWTSSEISSSVPRSCTRKRARLGEQSQGSDRHVKRLRLGDNDYWARNNLKVYVLPPETSKHSREGTYGYYTNATRGDDDEVGRRDHHESPSISQEQIMRSSLQCDDEIQDTPLASQEKDSSTESTVLDDTSTSMSLSVQSQSSAAEDNQVVVQPVVYRQRNRRPQDEKRTMRAMALQLCYEYRKKGLPVPEAPPSGYKRDMAITRPVGPGTPASRPYVLSRLQPPVGPYEYNIRGMERTFLNIGTATQVTTTIFSDLTEAKIANYEATDSTRSRYYRLSETSTIVHTVSNPTTGDSVKAVTDPNAVTHWVLRRDLLLEDIGELDTEPDVGDSDDSEPFDDFLTEAFDQDNDMETTLGNDFDGTGQTEGLGSISDSDSDSDPEEPMPRPGVSYAWPDDPSRF